LYWSTQSDWLEETVGIYLIYFCEFLFLYLWITTIYLFGTMQPFSPHKYEADQELSGLEWLLKRFWQRNQCNAHQWAL